MGRAYVLLSLSTCEGIILGPRQFWWREPHGNFASGHTRHHEEPPPRKTVNFTRQVGRAVDKLFRHHDSVANAPVDCEQLCRDILGRCKMIPRFYIHPAWSLTYSESETHACVPAQSARVGVYLCQVANHGSRRAVISPPKPGRAATNGCTSRQCP